MFEKGHYGNLKLRKVSLKDQEALNSHRILKEKLPFRTPKNFLNLAYAPARFLCSLFFKKMNWSFDHRIKSANGIFIITRDNYMGFRKNRILVVYYVDT